MSLASSIASRTGECARSRARSSAWVGAAVRVASRPATSRAERADASRVSSRAKSANETTTIALATSDDRAQKPLQHADRVRREWGRGNG